MKRYWDEVQDETVLVAMYVCHHHSMNLPATAAAAAASHSDHFTQHLARQTFITQWPLYTALSDYRAGKHSSIYCLTLWPTVVASWGSALDGVWLCPHLESFIGNSAFWCILRVFLRFDFLLLFSFFRDFSLTILEFWLFQIFQVKWSCWHQ